MRRRRRKHNTLDELMVVAAVAGGMYLLLRYVAGTPGTAAAFAGVALGGVLVGASLRPWADRIARRFGVRIVRVGTPIPRRTPAPKDGTTPKGKRP
jgi:queuine/archaeosine tRNA-ribosyltransferase